MILLRFLLRQQTTKQRVCQKHRVQNSVRKCAIAKRSSRLSKPGIGTFSKPKNKKRTIDKPITRTFLQKKKKKNRRCSRMHTRFSPDLRALACKSVVQIVQIQNIRTDFKVLEMPGLLQEEQRNTNFRTAKSCNAITQGTMRDSIIAQSVLGGTNKNLCGRRKDTKQRLETGEQVATPIATTERPTVCNRDLHSKLLTRETYLLFG